MYYHDSSGQRELAMTRTTPPLTPMLELQWQQKRRPALYKERNTITLNPGRQRLK
jgi:hypothetical protein